MTDNKAETQGHDVIHLSVAHCELNAVVLARAHVKEHVRKYNQQITMVEVEYVTLAGIEMTTVDQDIEECRRVEDKYCNRRNNKNLPLNLCRR